MNIKEAEKFYLSAANYCKVVENTDHVNESNLLSLLHALLDLYSKAHILPDVEIENEEEVNFEMPILEIDFNKYDLYWEVFDPYYLDKPVRASLSDDILDIYKDVKRGLLLFEKNKFTNAIWQWKFNFEIHWDSHAVDAIRVLHSAKSI